MAKQRSSSVPPADPTAGTVRQWKPPVHATMDMPVSGERPRDEMGLAQTVQAETPIASQAPGQPPPLAPGDVVADRYIVEEHVSSGGFGAVYRASDRQIRNHQVALKVLHTPAASEQAQQGALRELALIASVSHPSVVQFKDYGWIDGRLWFAMPWYRGRTLDVRVADEGLTRRDARPIFERLAQGLAAMHEVGVQHHDIKPENIFLADIAGFDGGLPVLLDLGIAAERGEGPKGLTIEYAAPETAASALGDKTHEIGEPADVFSLALVLRNLLEPATRPTTGVEALALLHSRANEPIAPPKGKEFRHMRAAFTRWLALDPDARPSASELARELSVLTAPEDLRQARLRLLKRIVPVVAVAGLLVAGLWFQVREKETRITQQAELLTEEMRASAQLRERTKDQLAQLESQSARIGSQERDLRKAIGIARDLDKRLESAQQRGETLDRKLKRTTDERDTLTAEKTALTAERDGLLSDKARLEETRTRLTGERDALQAERDGLAAERTQLSAERDRLTQERDALVERRKQLEGELAKAEAAAAAAEKAEAAMRKERDEMAVKREALKADKAKLERELKELEAEKARLERTAKSAEDRQTRVEKKLRAIKRPEPSP